MEHRSSIASIFYSCTLSESIWCAISLCMLQITNALINPLENQTILQQFTWRYVIFQKLQLKSWLQNPNFVQ